MIVLTVLREFGERGQSNLGQASGVDATTTVALFNDLESRGLVERRRSPRDRRRHTAAGRRRLEQREAIVASPEGQMFDIDSGQRPGSAGARARAVATPNTVGRTLITVKTKVHDGDMLRAPPSNMLLTTAFAPRPRKPGYRDAHANQPPRAHGPVVADR